MSTIWRQFILGRDHVMLNKALELSTAYTPGMIRFYTNFDRQDAVPIGNVASMRLDIFMHGCLLDLEEQFLPHLDSLIAWLEESISAGEEQRFGNAPEFHSMILNRALGVARWLKGEDRRADEAIGRAFHSFCEFASKTYQQGDIMQDTLGDILILGCKAKLFAGVIDAYEKLSGSSSKQLRPSAFCYQFSLNAVKKAEPEELFEARQDRILKRIWAKKSNPSLDTRMALWLKHRYRNKDVSALDKLKLVAKYW